MERCVTGCGICIALDKFSDIVFYFIFSLYLTLKRKNIITKYFHKHLDNYFPIINKNYSCEYVAETIP